MGLAALGAAFSTLPEAARTITQTVTKQVGVGTPVFAGLWPDGVFGRMVDKGLGFSGNITGIDGSSGIVGRMRYKLLDGGLPITTTTNTVIPFDPMTMVVAAALISIDKKLDALQEKAVEILQFLKLEKQSKQRGNLNMLAEIMEEYKVIVNCTPVGMYPKADEYPNIPYEYITPNHLLYDLLYNPNTTLFMKKGADKGAVTKNGLEMLLLQAYAAWDIWER